VKDAVEQPRLLHLDEVQHTEPVQSAMDDQIENDSGVFVRLQLLDPGVTFLDEVDEEAFTLQWKSKDYFRGTVVFDDEYAFWAHYVYNYMPHCATKDSLSWRS
jgi:hypothetical protein